MWLWAASDWLRICSNVGYLDPESDELLKLYPGNIYFISVGNDSSSTAVFDLETEIVTQEEKEDYFKQLGEINDGLAPPLVVESNEYGGSSGFRYAGLDAGISG